MTLSEYLTRLAGYIPVLEKLEEQWAARRAMSALEEWRSDLSTARPWRAVFAELEVDVSGEESSKG